LETNCTGNKPNTFALCSQKAIHLFPREHGEILEGLEVGREMAFWRTKAAISLKRVKMEEKLLWSTYRNSPTFFRTVPSPTPYGLGFLETGGLQLSYPLLSQERVKLRTLFCRNIHGIDRNKRPWIMFGIVALGVVRESRKFSGHPLRGHLCDSTLAQLSCIPGTEVEVLMGISIFSQTTKVRLSRG